MKRLLTKHVRWCLFGLLGFLFFNSSLSFAQTLNIRAITWDVIGLDSNSPTSGPDNFPVGVRVCNTGSAAATNVTATISETGTDNTYISLSGATSISAGSISAGTDTGYPYAIQTTAKTKPANCYDFYFAVSITQTSSAHNTTQGYTISVTSSNASTVSRSGTLYVEKLVSQNRNSAIGISGPSNVTVGGTYDFTLTSSTATNGYEEIESVINFPFLLFQVLEVSTTYSVPKSGTSVGQNSTAWGDACGWDYSPLPGDCDGTDNYSGGKAGGEITTTFKVKILSNGDATLKATIYDFSGSSFHYNSDYAGFSVSTRAWNPPVVSKSFSPSTIRVGQTSTMTITITNNNTFSTNMSSIAFTDTYPSGLVNASTPNASTTCGGTVTATAGGSSLVLSGGSIAASSSCTVTVTVTSSSSTATTHTNTIAAGGVTTSVSGSNTSASSATLTVVEQDFGDAPDTGTGTGTGNYKTTESDGGPYHTKVTGLALGSSVDTDTGTAQNSAATSDDTTGTDDEDAVSSFNDLVVGATSYSVSVNATNSMGSTAYLVGYIDFNKDGDFDDSGEESSPVTVSSNSTTNPRSFTVNFTPPSGMTTGTTYARFRLSNTSSEAQESIGSSSSGEVEDYSLTIKASISGTVFEDVNYGGGVGRSLTTSSGVVRTGVRVELYDSTGAYQSAVLTDSSGNYSFNVSGSSSYTVRVVNSFVTSSRSGGCTASTSLTTAPSSCTQVPVQTFRVNSGSADTNRVGGEDPTKVDASANTTSATLSSLTTTTTAAQSISSVTVTTSNVTGVDFGFNFDTIVNKNDSGQGSLRQFITNSNALGGESSLAQSGSRLERVSLSDTTLGTASLPTGKETSIFMIPASQLVSGVASINLLSLLPAINNATTSANAENTIIDGTTQSVNIGNSNTGTLGTGGTVGVDALTLPVMQKPEVEITDGAGLARGIDMQASNVTVRGIAMYGFGSSRSPVGDANIRVGSSSTTNYTGTLIEENILGIPASSTSISDPASTTVGRTGGDGFVAVGADSGTFRYNLTAYNELMGAMWTTTANSWTITGNESRSNGISATVLNQDGFSIEGSSTGVVVTGNLAINNGANGIELIGSSGNVQNNTIKGNGTQNVETPGIRIGGTGGFTIYRNIIEANTGAGVMVRSAAGGNTISQNSIFSNGTIGSTPTNQIGIDLHSSSDNAQLGTSPFVSLNDDGDSDTGGNSRLNFPVFEKAEINGANLLLTGWARAGALLELFIADPDPTGFGEGKTYLTFMIEGSTGTLADNDTSSSSYSHTVTLFSTSYTYTETTNRFSFTIPLTSLPGVAVGTQLTATATCLSANSCSSATSGSTSEFSELIAVTTSENPEIGLAKALDRIVHSNGATDNTYTLVYRLTVENFGDVALSDLELFDDVVTQFSGLTPTNYNVWVTDNLATLSPAPTLTLDGSWNGTASSNILATGQSLAVGASKLVYLSFMVTVDPSAVSPDNRLRDNSATAEGTSPSSTNVTDTSTNGLDPDDDNDGVVEASDTDNTPSESSATPAPFVKLIKEVRNCGNSLSSCGGTYAVTATGQPGDYLEYRVRYINISSQTISALVVKDTLVSATPFQEDTYSIIAPDVADFSVMCPDTSVEDLDRTNAAVVTTPVSGAITAFDLAVTTACSLSTVVPGEQGEVLFKVKIP